MWNLPDFTGLFEALAGVTGLVLGVMLTLAICLVTGAATISPAGAGYLVAGAVVGALAGYAGAKGAL